MGVVVLCEGDSTGPGLECVFWRRGAVSGIVSGGVVGVIVSVGEIADIVLVDVTDGGCL